MKIKKITVQRVYPVRQYENIRIQFEVEVEEGENTREIVYIVNEEILKMEEVLAMFQHAKSRYEDLENKVKNSPRLGMYADIFEKYLEETKRILEDKYKTLGCLEKVDPSNIEALTVCMNELGISTLTQIEAKKEELKQKISEIEKHLERIKTVEEEYQQFRDEFPKMLSKAREKFVRGNYDDAYKILDETIDRIQELMNKISELNPDNYKYNWR